MNSLYNHALKQVNSIQQDLKKFETGEDTSVGLQGQISASLNALDRSIDDYDAMARREMVALKRETALARVRKFRDDYSELKSQLERYKLKNETRAAQNSERNELLGRRHTRPPANNTPEFPYQAQRQYIARERNFANETEHQLDQFIAQAQSVLENLTDQHGILKKTQRKLLDTANTLGLSQTVIRYIERRSAEDKWIFLGGVSVTLLLMWAIVHYLR